jgi:hypothetical protein
MRKYLLKYALEFLVIVMGISVSFWLNNWNDNNKYKKVRNEFLISLKQELMLDTIQLSRKIAELTTANDAVTKGITLTDKVNHTEIEKKEFQSAIRPIMMLTPLNKNTNKNDSKISSGIIENVQLNNQLIEYYEEINYHKEVMKKFGESLQSVYLNQIIPYIRLNPNKTIDYSLNTLKNNNSFRNAFYISTGYRNQSIMWLERQKNKAISLLSDIDKYIE